ncbi:hypothetical protein [Phenylobacterium sp.]|jgi:hypothetical protein|uniref:hypothetical protein n=1 Tax=Phenylobacterium sp. TaxID=1871053 RepID=UPI002F91FDF6
MPDEKPETRPEPKRPAPDVYGGQWGPSGEGQAGEGEIDRPDRIKVPKDEPGAGEQS